MTRILVLGATGMLGNAVYTVLSHSPGLAVQGTVRSSHAAQLFQPDLVSGLVESADLEDLVQLERLLDLSAPDVVINCLAARKPLSTDPMKTVAVFAVLPQRLSLLCAQRGARMIQMGTDGVFSGARGNYSEADLPDAADVYGVAKLLGEVTGPHAITLRSSIVGPEPRGGSGLLEWFLAQRDRCTAYARVVFSGLPTNVLAEIIRDEILPRPELCGVYHLAAAAISKHDLLRLIARSYRLDIDLVPADTPVSDRSLDASRFAAATGYTAPDWPNLVDAMHSYHRSLKRT